MSSSSLSSLTGGARVHTSKTSTTTAPPTTTTTLRARYCRNTNRPTTRMSNNHHHRAATSSAIAAEGGATDARGSSSSSNKQQQQQNLLWRRDRQRQPADPPPSGTAFDVVVIGNGPIGAAVGLHVQKCEEEEKDVDFRLRASERELRIGRSRRIVRPLDAEGRDEWTQLNIDSIRSFDEIQRRVK